MSQAAIASRHHSQCALPGTLLCVTGLSPQIITETLYALIERDGRDRLPGRIVVVTTARGRELIENELIDPAGPRQLARLLADNDIEPDRVSLAPPDIHVITDRHGAPLDDIRRQRDNEAAADLIFQAVRALTEDPRERLHASIAGGRKTMGFYLGHAMSLLARAGDEVSHVLVNAPFEGHPDFYFPPRTPTMLRVHENGRIRRIRTDRAVIMLAPIPIIRLRPSLPAQLLDPAASYSQAIELAQRSLDPPHLIIDLDRKMISCSGRQLRLAGAQLGLLAWMADRIKRGHGGVHRRQISACADDILRWRARVTGVHSGSSEGLEQAARLGAIDESWFDHTNARLRQTLNKKLGHELARHYRIEQPAGRRLQPYQMALAPDQIEFAVLPDPGEVRP